jgi:hypothetical protein
MNHSLPIQCSQPLCFCQFSTTNLFSCHLVYELVVEIWADNFDISTIFNKIQFMVQKIGLPIHSLNLDLITIQQIFITTIAVTA